MLLLSLDRHEYISITRCQDCRSRSVMNAVSAIPEQPPPERRLKFEVLLTVSLACILVVALVLVLPLITSLGANRRVISLNWSGYSVVSDLNNPQPQVTSVNASWTVPAINPSVTPASSAIWIGVGGQFEQDHTLIQTGTEQDSKNGRGIYSAWYEMLNGSVVTIDSLRVTPGNTIVASISLLNQATDTWSIEIQVVTNGQSFQRSFNYNSSMLSAEWILERPAINTSFGTLANFGETTFTGCAATIDGKAGTISSFPSMRLTMYNQQHIELASVSSLMSGGSSFTIYYQD